MLGKTRFFKNDTWITHVLEITNDDFLSYIVSVTTNKMFGYKDFEFDMLTYKTENRMNEKYLSFLQSIKLGCEITPCNDTPELDLEYLQCRNDFMFRKIDKLLVLELPCGKPNPLSNVRDAKHYNDLKDVVLSFMFSERQKSTFEKYFNTQSYINDKKMFETFSRHAEINIPF